MVVAGKIATSNARNEESSISSFEISDLLPLELIKSETIPPSPHHSESTVDWLADFAGFSWIAYGASSLLVISHFPSPLSQEETLIGPFFRQSIELSDNESAIVKAVAWSPTVPSEGEVAVAIENCIFFCSCLESSRRTHGCFCWSQIAVLVQSYAVDAIKWTGSGDGIITAGIEVVLWKRKSKTWEIAWKFTAEQPQTLVSATWSTDGPAATVACSNGSTSLYREASRCVLVCQSDGKSGFVKSELLHPQPASMIQWRPSTGTCWQRDVLLTCCLDGTVRLWSEIDSGRVKKTCKDINNQKGTRKSFHVISVIEINQFLNGSLGIDICVTWAVEVKGMINTGDRVRQCLSNEGSEHEKPGRCEWLIGFGPGASLSFWAVHCLDDISPLRFPRVTLWKRQDLWGPKGDCIQNNGNLKSKYKSLLIKAVISRSQLSGPPTLCSLIQLSPDNVMSWSQLYTLASSNTIDRSLSLDGHIGNILQIAVHPYSCEVELAVSLDSNGLLLFWLLSTISNCILGMPTVVLPTWKLLGSFVTRDLSCSEYSSLTWAPSVLNENQILLMGHAGGIDCFLIRISESEEDKIVCHKLCTMPFTGHSHGDGPAKIFAIPLASTSRQTFISNNFLLLGVWMQEFQALSWKVSLHSDELSGSICGCTVDVGGTANSSAWRCESNFFGKRYCVIADPWSSKLPDLHHHDQVTSVAVVQPSSWLPSIQQKWVSSNGMCSSSASYHMATGCSNGSVKLWRSTPSKSTPHSELAHIPWDLVGMFTAHQGPVSAISLSNCGQKIATICVEDHLNKASNLRIWETVRVIGAGNFLLEDNISLDGVVIALNWLSMGNGQLLLGVCMQNELLVFARRRFSNQTLVKSGSALETHIWICIAFGRTALAVLDFLWGPGATPMLVHDRYFCLFSKWSFGMDKKHQDKCYTNCTKGNPLHSLGGTDEDMFCAIFSDCKEVSMDGKSEERMQILPSRINLKNDFRTCNLFSIMSQQHYDSGTKIGCWSMLEVAEKLCGSLPIYHPEALLMNIYSGNWRRACVAVRHLVGYLTSDNTSVTCEKVYNSTRPGHFIPQIDLSKYFEGPSSASSGDKGGLQWGRDAALFTSATQYQKSSFPFFGNNSDSNALNRESTSTCGNSEINGFIETIEKAHDVAALTNLEKIQMLAVIDLLIEISDSRRASVYESLDEPGRRFWVAVRFQQLYFLRRFGRLAVMEDLVVESGLIGWAYHSDCQENLFTSLLSSESSWPEMRNLGVGFWFTNVSQLRTRMEKLARLQYLKKKDPKDCALIYVALNRLQVLAGLFKVSKDEKDKPLVGFLSRNFQEEKNKAAALKNAYVLMGRHQLELAIAFFLLGGDPSSAVNVCAKNLRDEQLALVISRLVEGYGGPLERHLISKFLLPTAIEKRDYWLASLLECALGNYSQSFLELFGFQMDSLIKKSILPSNQAAFTDPTVGQYCLILATKNSMKNSVGEYAAAILARWATLMTSTALNRCGLPLEALECLSCSLSNLEVKDQGIISDIGQHGILHGLLKASQSDTSNWLFGDVALHLESNVKLDLALQYISKLILEHPSWPDTILASCGPFVCYKEHETCQYELSLEKFHHKLNMGLTTFEQKYYLNSIDLINMILVSSCNNGLLFLGYHILHGYTSRVHPNDKKHIVDSLILYPTILRLFLKAIEEVSYLFARYIVPCSITCCPPNPSSSELNMFGSNKSSKLHAWDVYLQALIHSVKSLRNMLKIYLSGFLAEDLTMKSFISFDLFEFYLLFASAWLHGNLKGLILMIHPILIPHTNGHNPEIDVSNLKKLLFLSAELKTCDLLSDDVGCPPVATCKQWQHEQSEHIMSSIPEDERWQLIGACLWRHLSNFTKDQLKAVCVSLEDGCSTPSSSAFNYKSFESDGNRTPIPFKQVPEFLVKLLKSTLACICSSHAKQLASFLSQKEEKGFLVPTLAWLEESKSQPKPMYSCLDQGIDSLQLINNKSWTSLFEILWEISADPREIRESFSEEKISLLKSINHKSSKGWSDMHKGTTSGSENVDTSNLDQEGRVGNTTNGGTGPPNGRQSRDSHIFSGSRRKESTVSKEGTCFQNPKEIFKRNGELIEAMCINSIDHQEVALASNRKGIMIFKRKDEDLFKHQSDYIWSVADWPQNGWAGSESTPIPTFVSPGIGLGSKKGAHLGLGGATIGLGSLARPGRDLTGGGAFGIPGYAGIGSSGLGWGTQEDFEELADPPATVDNINTRALSSHPSRPFFLAGSSNTHVYLWEFGKERATATYGVLPAANVPPPYALASISALQFDHCGHRFATAALDGTVCTWQLEVGGRSNVRPTESSLCFNSHASDITYVAASGSVIAAAGYSSNDVNVVIWDTLAPPTTSQVSLICHEGGVRSLSVFDNDIGSGSISPLIVTGGKGGDVGLHDFRFIATGKTKRHRHSNATHDTLSGVSNKFGEQNRMGMLWYIPKAHLGSVTRIATIPDTNFFLTGSKDGDVKLWDAKRSKLIFHWPKLHERHTFLQPSSRGFGGVVQAAVTDILVLSHGFLTCGGDGTVKQVQLKDSV